VLTQGNNTLYGYAPDGSLLDGGAGNDVLIGDVSVLTPGNVHVVSYSALSVAGGVNASLAIAGAQNTGAGGTDTFIGIGGLIGTRFNDTLTGDGGKNLLNGGLGNDLMSGGAGDDVLFGEDGDDTLIGGAGADNLEGGAGAGDTVTYLGSTAGVNVTIGGPSGVGGDALGDTLFDIEILIGSAFADTLTGDGAANIIEGRGGADVLDGGGGLDTVSYANSAAAVTVDLTRLSTTLGALGAQVSAGDAAGDRLIGFTKILGSAFNDTLMGDGGANTLTGGLGNDVLRGGGFGDLIDGGAGTSDTASYAGLGGGVNIDLFEVNQNSNPASSAGGDAAGDTLVGIENITGSDGDDLLSGDLTLSGNILNGGSGNDTIEGEDGNDTLIGGAGIDTLRFDFASVVTVNLTVLTAQNTGEGLDVISGFENITGTGGNDRLTGDGGLNRLEGRSGSDLLDGGLGSDTLLGEDGDDTLIGGAGADSLDGGEGGETVGVGDTVSYLASSAGVTVNLTLAGAQIGLGDGLGDTLAGIENLIGSALGDTLTGDNQNNVIEGRGGADSLTGGGGTFDTVSYANSAAGVTVDLTRLSSIVGALGAQVSGGDAAGDRLIGFVDILGSAFNDTLIGDLNQNFLTGGLGNDVLRGGLGADRLDGGAGTSDTASYAGSLTGGITVDLYEINVNSASPTGGDANGDTLVGIENITGSDGDDLLSGDLGSNILNGGIGNDTIEGEDGNDTLIGGSGVDTLRFTFANNISVNLSVLTAQNTGEGLDVISGFENIIGTSSNDTLTGDGAINNLNGAAGSDLINGGGGNDVLSGDSALGGGDDTLNGGDGEDALLAYDGNDVLNGGAGADVIQGGDNIDTAIYLGSLAGVNVDLTKQGIAGPAGLQIGGDAAGDSLSGIENLIGSALGDTLTGDGEANIIEGRGGADVLVGGLGTDTVSYANSAAAVTVDLTRLSFMPGLNGSQISGGDAAGDRLSGFENILGSAFNDTLTGDGGQNTLTGGLGNDVLKGGELGDLIDGGAGTSDTASYAGSLTGGITVDLYEINVSSASPTGGDANGDTLVGIENITGSDGDDLLSGDFGSNILNGGKGNDTIEGEDGNDTLIGGDGVDTLRFDFASAVTVNLSVLTAQNTGDGLDVISGFENITGTGSNDTLTGDGGLNRLEGRNGNDLLNGGLNNDELFGGEGDDTLIGGAGADQLDGGEGTETVGDTVTYLASAAGVNISLGGVPGSGGDAAGDQLFAIENLIGSAFADTLTGDFGANVIEGRGGADRLISSGSFSGVDTVSYANSAAGVTVSLLLDGSLLVGGAQVSAGDAAGDRLSGFKDIIGSAFNDTLIGDSDANQLFGGLGNDVLRGGGAGDRLDGGVSGIDTASYEGSAGSVIVSLANLAGLSGGDAQGDTLVGIENLIGSSNADSLAGDDGANIINGGNGDDTISGGLGNDTLIGGLGVDSLNFSAASGPIALNLTLTTAQNVGAGLDVMTGFENITGTNFADTLTGDGFANSLVGGGGDDLLIGGAGDDRLFGDAGFDTLIGGAGADLLQGSADDTVSYLTSAAGVTVSLLAGTGLGGDAQGDTLVGFQSLIGSAFGDMLTGDDESNIIEGRGGADILSGSGQGTEGDIASYSNSTAAVNVDLSKQGVAGAGGLQIGGDASGDRLSGFEHILGSAFNDTLTGDSGNNTLTGGLGNDVLKGGAGADTLDGGAGTSDTASYAGSTAGGVTVNVGEQVQTGGDASGDLWIGIENVIGSELGDAISGTADANILNGGGGDDDIEGRGGNDTLIGGTGFDSVFFSSFGGGVAVNLAITTAQNIGAGAVVISGFEGLIGTSFNDTLTGDGNANSILAGDREDLISGGGGNDTLLGDLGDDTLIGGAGADSLDGGDGGEDIGDVVSYLTSAAGVNVSLVANVVGIGGDAAGDTLVGVEHLIGSGLGDTLTGDGAANIIEGRGGADSLTGGSGLDTVSYANSAAGVTVDLTRLSTTVGALGAQVSAGDASGDRLIGFENILGSAFNDTLTGDNGDNSLTGGMGNDVLRGGAGADFLDGGAGTSDTVSYVGSVAGVYVGLSANQFALFGDADGDQIFGFENIIGSDVGDTLIGGAAANIINGGGGDDVIRGSGGNDTLIGGLNAALGGDLASYSDATVGVIVNLAITTAQNTLGAGIDVLSGIENLEGSGFNDTLTGDGLANRFFGGIGNDVLSGGLGLDTLFGNDGDDTLIGGAGADALFGDGQALNGLGDTASYLTSVAGVNVSLVTNSGQFGDAQGDLLIGIENLIGSGLGDTLSGNSGVNLIEGRSGADVLDGGGGIDTLSYANSAAAVTVDLALVSTGVGNGTAQTSGGDAAGDRLNGFENVLGSAFGDTLRGDAGANYLFGGLGANVLEGRDGADTLDGLAGNDDTASYASSTAAVLVDLRNVLQTVAGSHATGDELLGIENLLGSALGDVFVGNDGHNRIDGGAGDDVIRGGLGNDTLIGGLNSPGTGSGDLLDYIGSAGGVVVSLAITTAQNTVSAGIDVISGFETLSGSQFDDRLTGDALFNRLLGGDGNDTLVGGGGIDELVGGAGADHFVFNVAPSAANADKISDFAVGVDKIVLENAVMPGLGLGTGPLLPSQFALVGEVLTPLDRIIFDATTGELFYDSNGSAAGGSALLATFSSLNLAQIQALGGLKASDFLII
jgi:Ca2+-binding RTX toxin-like protein